MDTTTFRKAFSDYRKVEASVLSAQSNQWILHAERSANSIDLATIKQPKWHVPYAGFAPVRTMETKKLYPQRVSDLMPFSSTYTVNPTMGTERLFLDQWHQGLGLPTRQDDQAIRAFAIENKREFIDSVRSLMENQRIEEYKEVEGNRILGLARNFFGAISGSKTRGALYTIANEVYNQLVLYNSKIAPESLKSIYDMIEKITNDKNSGRLDIRIQQAIEDLPKHQQSPVQEASAKGGADPTDTSHPLDNLPTTTTAPSTTDTNLVPSGTTPGTSTTGTTGTTGTTTTGTTTGTTGTTGTTTTPAPGSNPTGTTGTIVPAKTPTFDGPKPPGQDGLKTAENTVPGELKPITNDPMVVVPGDLRDDVKLLTLQDLQTFKDIFIRSRSLIENAYRSNENKVLNPSSTYPIADTSISRPIPTGSQKAYVEAMNALTLKTQKENDKNMKIQEYMTKGMTDVQAREQVAKDALKTAQTAGPTEAAAALQRNMEEQARQVNVNNTQLVTNNIKSPLPLPPGPPQPPPPITTPPITDPITQPPVLIPEVPTDTKTVENQNNQQVVVPVPPAPVVTIYSDFKDQFSVLKGLWVLGKTFSAYDFSQYIYKQLGSEPPDADAYEGVKSNSFFYQKKTVMYSTMDTLMRIGFFDVPLPPDLPDKSFTFTRSGFTPKSFVTNWGFKVFAPMDDYRLQKGVVELQGMGRGTKRTSEGCGRSKISFAPGYKPKKLRKLERQKQ